MSAVTPMRRVPADPAVEALADSMLDAVPDQVEETPVERARAKPRAGKSALVERQLRTEHVEKLVRVSCHVPRQRQFVARRGAAMLNMSVDAFMAACLEDGLRKLGLLGEGG